MPTYRIKKAGWFMGKYYAEGTELNMHEKQAKYAVLSGQLEVVGKKAAKLDVPKKAPPGPMEVAAPPKPKASERASRKVGGSFGGSFME